MRVGTPQWFSWLDTISSFAYEDDCGTFTARKEPSKTSKGYWKAYRKRHNKLYQFYLGKSEDLTAERLQEAAETLANRSQAAVALPEEETGDPLNGAQELESSFPSPAAPTEAENPVTFPSLDETAAAEVETIIATKLHPPATRRRLVVRSRLLERLNQLDHYKLSLLSAPPGFGKTTLVAQWLKENHYPAGWISLDAQDNDPARFWRYFTQALETFKPDISRAVAQLFRPLSTTQLVTVLINQLALLPPDFEFVLVLDDYHIINSDTIHQGVQLLVERLPVQMHLLIISRSEPPLPLPRMRARGELNEIKVRDLRFTIEESQTFFQEVMGLNLAKQQVMALEEHAEGWIAGLQLAALGMQGQTDTESFIYSFQGSHRFVFDYLAEEVLEQQGPVIRNFLLQTSILGQLCAPLVEAVTGCDNGQALLEQLEAANLFVVALDQERHWYRYHNLFGEYLRSRLQLEQPEHVGLLHRWAAEWYEEQGMLAEAIEHSLMAKNYEQVAGLLERLATPLRRGEWFTLAKWLKTVPQALISERPRLILDYIWVLINDQQLSQAETWLECLLKIMAGTITLQNPIDLEFLTEPDWQAELMSAQAWLAFNQGDIIRTLELCRAVLMLKRASGAFIHLNFLSLIEQSYRFDDESVFSQMIPLAEELAQLSRQLNQPFVTLFALYILVACKRQEAQFEEAYQLCQEILETVSREPQVEVSTQHLILLIYVYLGVTSYYLNRLTEAETDVRRGIALAHRYHNDRDEFLLLTLLARVKIAQHDEEALEELLQEINQIAPNFKANDPSVATAQAAVVTVWLYTGNLEAADQWAKQQPLNPEAKLSVSKEWVYLVLAQVYLAHQQYQAAVDLLERLEELGIQPKRRFLVARTTTLLALALYKQNRLEPALARLTLSLEIAAPEGLTRVYLEYGQPMAALLRAYLQNPSATPAITNFIQHLLPRFDEPYQPASSQPEQISPLPAQSLRPGGNSALIEPLSMRERQVLKLLATSLSSIEIGRELVVATSTVRTHIKNIYAKLEVQRRAEAISRAKELGLL